MPENIVPVSGITPDKLFAKQQYRVDSISHNMFSSTTSKDKKLIVPATLLQGVTIGKLWEAIFSDSSDFLQTYHESRKASNILLTPWEYAPDYSNGYRSVSMTLILDVPKANTVAQLKEAHRFAYTITSDDKLMLVYQISSQVPSVPGGTSFRTESLCEITADSATTDCQISFWGNCKKMTLMFSAIQYLVIPRAMKDMTSAYTQMVSMIAARLCKSSNITIPQLQDIDIAEINPSQAKEEFEINEKAFPDSNLNTVLPGVLLSLALMISLVLVWSIFSIRSASHATKRTFRLMQMRDESISWRGYSETLKESQLFSTKYRNTSVSMCTEEDILLSTAREAHMRLLRAYLLEQRDTISHIQRSMSMMRITMIIQWIVLLVLGIKIYYN